MTKLKKSAKMKTILILLLTFALSLTAFFFTACKEDETYKEKTYTYDWTDDSDIVNGSFEYGVHDLKASDYPQKNPSNWSFKVDTSANASNVNSGIIDVSEDGYYEYLKTLCKDSDFLNYLNVKFGVDISGYSSKTDEEKEEFIDTYVVPNFANPLTHTGAEGKHVLAINNYKYEYGFGTAQSATSSTNLTLEKGKYALISVWVKTVNLEYLNSGAKDLGANIRVANKFASTTQKEYRVSGIDCADWTEYKIYIKTDEYIDNVVTLSLGLGYGSKNDNSKYVRGTAYFDDLTVSYVEESDFVSASATVFKFTVGSSEVIDNTAKDGDTSFYYDMTEKDMLEENYDTYFDSFDVSDAEVGYLEDKDANKTGTGYSTVSPDKSVTGNVLTVTSDYSAVSVKFGSKDNPIRVIDPESATFVSFYIKNQLSVLSNKDITLRVYDVLYGEEILHKDSHVIAINKDEDHEWTRVIFKVANNYPEKDAEGLYPDTQRGFWFELVLGPTDLSSKLAKYQYANGSVLIKDVTYSQQTDTYQYQRDYEYDLGRIIDYTVLPAIETNKTTYYDMYSLYNSILYSDGSKSASFALFNGRNSDYSASSDTENYSFNVAVSEIGTPVANAKGWIGVDYNNLKYQESVNTRSGDGDNGSFAGVVNSDTLRTFNSSFADALNYSGAKAIQPLMIYNATEDSYGYIGSSINLALNSSNKFSVKVKAVDGAKAYVYLVDTTSVNKDVLSISVPVNTTGLNYQTPASPVTKNIEATGITSDMCVDAGGYITVTFYVGVGSTAKSVRLELWNGSRDGTEKSQGFVFFDGVSTGDTFTETTETFDNAFGSGVLKTIANNASLRGFRPEDLDTLLYRRELDSKEKAYNNDTSKKGDNVSYPAKYVWVKSDVDVYAIYNNLEYTATNPYDNEPVSEDSGCSASTNPSTFWMSFSSIILAVVLVFAIIALVIKTKRNRKKAYKNEATSHYTVKSRYSKKSIREDKPEKIEKEEKKEKEEPEEVSESTFEGSIDSESADDGATETAEESAPQETEEKEEYTYSEVQDFGEDENK